MCEARQIELQDESTITARDLSPPLSEMDLPIRLKISEDTTGLNGSIKQVAIIGTYRFLHPRSVG